METLSYYQLMERYVALEAEVVELRGREQEPVVVPDEIQKLKDGRGFKYVKAGVHYSVNYANGWNQCRAAMLQGADGNSPAIPDGYALVPVEPTAEMISSGIAAHYERSKIQIHDRPAPGPMTCAYVAMLEAAPQQEVK